MKKINFLLGLLLVASLFPIESYAQQMTYTNKRSGDGITVNYSIPDYKLTSVSYRGEEMQEIVLSGILIPNDEGMPNLPSISRYIAVPQGATVEVSIKDFKTEIVENVNIAPALRIQAESEEPEANYIKNVEVYSQDKNYPESPIVSQVTSVRGVDAVILSITPFQYNPVSKQLTVYRDINVDVTFVGGSKHIGDDKYRSPWFDPILQNVFMNYDALPKIDYSKRYQEYYSNKDGETGCEYLIVIPNREDFRPLAEQIKQHRVKQGIITKVMSLEEMECTTTSQMKTFFHNAYNTWDIPPVAIMLMGDHKSNMTQGIPAESYPHEYSGTCITDNLYADVTGDHLPEMVFTRMAAETIDQMNVLVSKMFEYELNPCMDTSYYNHPITALGWQTERWFQICSEVVGGYFRDHGKEPVRINAIYSGTPGSVWSTASNTEQVVNYFGPSGCDYIPQQPSVMGGWTGGTAAQVISAVNQGAFILQHRDHGYDSGWGEPSFSSSNVAQFTNVGKMLFLFTINCQTGKFDYNPACFGEVFQRHTYNGQNAGAVGFIAPTEVSYSFVNDAFAWGMYDLFDPDFMPNYGPFAANSGNWLPAFGNVAGKYFLQQTSWPYNTSEKDITYIMFTAHTDAFLRIYTEQPQTLAVDHTPTVMAGIAPFIITCDEGATIAISMNDDVLVVVTATGEQQEIELPFILPDSTLTVTCTKQNYLRYESEIITIPAEGPYIVGRGWSVNDANNDGTVDYAETFTLDYTLKNVGVEVASNVVATISSEDEYITFDNPVCAFGNVEADSLMTIANAFTLTASPVIPDGHVVYCVVTFTSGDTQWNANLNFKANAPTITMLSNGVEGELLPGETLNITGTFINTGGAEVYNAYGVYTTDCQYITINSAEPVYFGDLRAVNGTATGAFSITVSPDAPFGTVIPSTITLTADYGYSASGSFEPFLDICNVAISNYPYNEGYEDGEIPNCWTQEIVEGEAEWTTQDGGLYHHPYHAHTGLYNAFISGEDAIVKLVTPTLDISNVTDPVLTFWHAQSVQETSQDMLKVYYKNATDGQWIMIAQFPYSNASWKMREVVLPSPTANYYIAFEATLDGGFGVVLDDIQVTGTGVSLSGDVDGNGSVNVVDIMVAVNYVIGQNPSPFLFENADVNEDGSVNVIDVIGIANIIVGGNVKSSGCNDISVADCFVEDGILYIDSQVDIAGLQISANSEIISTESLIGMQTAAGWSTKDRYTFVAYSLDGTSIKAGKNAVCFVGDAKISEIILSDSFGCEIIADGSILGIEDNDIESLQAYPNPFSGTISLSYSINSTANNAEFVITNISGQVIDHIAAETTVGNHVTTWSPSATITPGMYFVTLIVDGTKVEQSKVVYQN